MKNVLILGATSDMAQAVARRFAAEGWSLTLAARDPNALTSLAADLRIRAAAEVHTAAFDALAFEEHARFYRDLPARPDVVICAFGYMGINEEAFTDVEEMRRTIDTNFTGAVSILNVIAADFEKRRRGTIVGISSVAGDRGRQSNFIYGSAKAGFSAYLSGLRNRLWRAGVHVMTVKPGFCRTKMTENLDLPPALTAEPEQVAEAIWKGIRKRRNTIYVLWMWRWIMLLIRLIPEPIFKRMNL